MEAPRRIYRVLTAILGQELSVTAMVLVLTTSPYYSTGVVRGNWIIFNEACRKRQKIVAEATNLKAAATATTAKIWQTTLTTEDGVTVAATNPTKAGSRARALSKVPQKEWVVLTQKLNKMIRVRQQHQQQQNQPQQHQPTQQYQNQNQQHQQSPSPRLIELILSPDPDMPPPEEFFNVIF